MTVTLSIVLGGLITILTAIVVEYLRRPRLTLAIENLPFDKPLGKKKRRNLRLILRNECLPSVLGWMQRAPATQCRGEITFRHLNDGQDIFGRSMEVRWANSPEPIASQIIDPSGQIHFQIRDFTRTSAESRIDVYPAEQELLDVAVRFEGEPDCYGWNNESYANEWRTPRWKLPHDRFLVKVIITSSGQKCSGVFHLINDVDSQADFRLLSTTAEERAKVL